MTPRKHGTMLHKSHWCQTQRAMHCKGGSHARVRTKCWHTQSKEWLCPTKTTQFDVQNVPDSAGHKMPAGRMQASAHAACCHACLAGGSQHVCTCLRGWQQRMLACTRMQHAHTHPHRYLVPTHTDTDTFIGTHTYPSATASAIHKDTRTDTHTDTNTGTEIHASTHVKLTISTLCGTWILAGSLADSHADVVAKCAALEYQRCAESTDRQASMQLLRCHHSQARVKLQQAELQQAELQQVQPKTPESNIGFDALCLPAAVPQQLDMAGESQLGLQEAAQVEFANKRQVVFLSRYQPCCHCCLSTRLRMHQHSMQRK